MRAFILISSKISTTEDEIHFNFELANIFFSLTVHNLNTESVQRQISLNGRLWSVVNK